MNYAVVVIGAIVIGAGLWFAIDAHKWFHGPVVNVECDSDSTESDMRNTAAQWLGRSFQFFDI